MNLADINARFRTQHGVSLSELSQQSSVLVLFLRHRGCTFCREALNDLNRQFPALEEEGVVPVIVHMGNNELDQDFFAKYGLQDTHRIADPSCELYQAYQLRRGGLTDVLNPVVWWKGFRAAILDRHGFGKIVGDVYQMGGVFLIQNNTILKAFRNSNPAERPDFCTIAKEASVAT